MLEARAVEPGYPVPEKCLLQPVQEYALESEEKPHFIIIQFCYTTHVTLQALIYYTCLERAKLPSSTKFRKEKIRNYYSFLVFRARHGFGSIASF